MTGQSVSIDRATFVPRVWWVARTGPWLTPLFVAAMVILAHPLRCDADARASVESTPEYRRHIQDALDAYEGGRYAESRLHFEQAYALYPNARTAHGVGQAALGQHDYVTAARYLEEALRSQVLPLEAAMRAADEAALQQAQARIARLSLLVQPAHAEVRLDGKRIDHSQTAPLEPGKHIIEASAPDFQPARHELQLAAGSDTRHELALVTSATSTAPLASAPWWRRNAPWLVVAASGAAFVTGGALLIVVNKEWSEGVPKGEYTWTEAEERDEWATRMFVSGGVVLGVGLGGVATGLLWRARRRQDAPIQVAIARNQLSLRGSF